MQIGNLRIFFYTVLTILLFLHCDAHYTKTYEFYHPVMSEVVCKFKWQYIKKDSDDIRAINIYARLPNDKIMGAMKELDLEGTVVNGHYFHLNQNCNSKTKLTQKKCKNGHDISCDLQHIKMDFVYPDKIVVIEQDVNLKKNKLNVFLISEDGIEFK